MRKFKMRCPVCGHIYWVENGEYEIETCPNCGHQAKFEEFVIGMIAESD